MSATAGGPTPSARLVNTTPSSHEPPALLVDAAAEALPAVMNTTPDHRYRPPAGAERVVPYGSLRLGLERLGHGRDAAEWAIHRHVGEGRLVAEPGQTTTPTLHRDGRRIGGHVGRTYDREQCLLRATPELWAWWDEVTRERSGSVLGSLRSEQAVLHAEARRRADEEQERRGRLAELTALRLRWAEAFKSAWGLEDDATAGGWDGVRKLDEFVTRLLRVGVILREWDDDHTRQVEAHPDRSWLDRRAWGERLRRAVTVADSPLEFRFAAGLLVIARDGNRAQLTQEIRHLLARRDLKPVTDWLPWLCDTIVPPSLAAPDDHIHTFYLPPLGRPDDEKRALRALSVGPSGLAALVRELEEAGEIMPASEGEKPVDAPTPSDGGGATDHATNPPAAAGGFDRTPPPASAESAGAADALAVARRVALDVIRKMIDGNMMALRTIELEEALATAGVRRNCAAVLLEFERDRVLIPLPPRPRDSSSRSAFFAAMLPPSGPTEWRIGPDALAAITATEPTEQHPGEGTPQGESTATAVLPAGGEKLPDTWASCCGGALHCSPDFGTVRRGDDTFHFSPTQRACIEFMVAGWKGGRREFTNQELLEKAGSTAEYIRDVFRSNGKSVPAWNSLIVEVEGKKGRYTLRLGSKPLN